MQASLLEEEEGIVIRIWFKYFQVSHELKMFILTRLLNQFYSKQINKLILKKDLFIQVRTKQAEFPIYLLLSELDFRLLPRPSNDTDFHKVWNLGSQENFLARSIVFSLVICIQVVV